MKIDSRMSKRRWYLERSGCMMRVIVAEFIHAGQVTFKISILILLIRVNYPNHNRGRYFPSVHGQSSFTPGFGVDPVPESRMEKVDCPLLDH